MDAIELTPCPFEKKTVCIVQFGPATVVSGFRPGEYYQVTIDPSQVSPNKNYIRFGNNQGDEILGWQRVDALTVVEILGEWDGEQPPDMTIGVSGVTLRVS